MKKHTNGPWLITTIDGDDCLMVGGGDGSDVVADIRTDRPEDEVEANAHLIASAPEMLAICKRLLKELSFVAKSEEYFSSNIEKQANAVIAHAEGRELGMNPSIESPSSIYYGGLVPTHGIYRVSSLELNGEYAVAISHHISESDAMADLAKAERFANAPVRIVEYLLPKEEEI
jgi:hypothetical protein